MAGFAVRLGSSRGCNPSEKNSNYLFNHYLLHCIFIFQFIFLIDLICSPKLYKVRIAYSNTKTFSKFPTKARKIFMKVTNDKPLYGYGMVLLTIV